MRQPLALSGLFALAALSACPPDHAEQPTTPAERCSPGLAYCDGNTAKLCSDRGTVASRERCGDTAVCVDGVCEGNVVCHPDERICVQNELRVCNSQGTGFAVEEPCGDAICVDGACVQSSGVCPANARYCIANSAYRCNADGSALLDGPVACGDGVCVNGNCEAVICNPGKADCDGSAARTCNALGTGYSVMESCQPPEDCVEGRCQELVCTPGRVCVGNTAVECNSQGTQIIDQRDCAGQRCVDGVCRNVDAGSGDGGGSDAASGDSARPDAASPDTRQPDAWQPDSALPDSALPDSTRPDSALPDSARPDSARPDAGDGPCVDGDHDGYGIGSGCLGRDCDDTKAEVHPGASEFGDGLDNDCDGSVDEGMSCPGGASAKACPSAGRCAGNNGAQQTCSNGIWTACPVAAIAEDCNGVDDDCNGTVDDLLEVHETCWAGTGACERQGHMACDADRQLVFCDVGISTALGAEACGNQIDDDCDGDTDESDCCPLRTSIDPSTQTCRRDQRGDLCTACTANSQCGSNLDFCVTVGSDTQTCTGTGRGTCPSDDYVCSYRDCYYDGDCPGGGTCEGGFLPLFPGSCTVGSCDYTVCGLDCRDGMPCPAGYACYGIYITGLDCETSACPVNDCYNRDTQGGSDYVCRQTGESCGASRPCAQLSCVEGRCQVGRNCLPAENQTCASIPATPACGSAGCGEGAQCSNNQCVANTSCSSTVRCPMGKKCVAGTCQAAEICYSNADCARPSFFCNSGYCDNAEACSGDGECPAGTYCELGANPAVCTPGCRLSGSSGCASDHHCASDHRCMLNTVQPGGRCAACDDNSNPCTAPGTFCNPITARCNLLCLSDNVACQSAIVPESECLFLGCTNPDCP